jgi:YhcH/YjgK/YiaL family protein
VILDTLERAALYTAMHPGLEAAFAFLRTTDLRRLPAGKTPIDGDRLYAMVVTGAAKGRAGTRLETHRAYIDIQFTLAGAETIGWTPLAQLRGGQGYNAGKDIEFFTDVVQAWIDVPPGTFAAFFPEDGHAPMAGQGDLHKVVLKIKATG